MLKKHTESESRKIIDLHEGVMSQSKIIKSSDSTVSITKKKFMEWGTLKHNRGNGEKRI